MRLLTIFFFFLFFFFSFHVFSQMTSTVTQRENEKLSKLEFAVDVGMPLLRTAQLNSIGAKKFSKFFSFNWFFSKSHGLFAGLGIDDYGQGEGLPLKTQKLTLREKGGLSGIQFLSGYSYRKNLRDRVHFNGDVGLGGYRFIGIKDSESKNFISFFQRVSFNYLLPDSIQLLENSIVHLGVAFSHSYLPKSSLKGTEIGGSIYTASLQMRIGHFFF